MKWIDRKDSQPNEESYVVLYRNKYPKYFWMGQFKNHAPYGYRYDDEEYTHWVQVEKPPEDDEEL